MFGSWKACIKARASVWERREAHRELADSRKLERSGSGKGWKYTGPKQACHTSTCACCEQFRVHVCTCLPHPCQVLHAELPQPVGARQTNPSLCKTAARGVGHPGSISHRLGWERLTVPKGRESRRTRARHCRTLLLRHRKRSSYLDFMADIKQSLKLTL